MRILAITLLALAACKDVKTPTEANPEEVITTVELTIDGTVYTWDDPENDGDPVIDAITLTAGEDLPMSVRFLNALEDPPEDITEEVADESDEHQVFVGGYGFAYGDTDANGLPVGLDGTLSAGPAGTGTLEIVLQHLPEQSGVAQKIDGLADTYATDGASALPGETDAMVSFPVTVE